MFLADIGVRDDADLLRNWAGFFDALAEENDNLGTMSGYSIVPDYRYGGGSLVLCVFEHGLIFVGLDRAVVWVALTRRFDDDAPLQIHKEN